MSSSSMKDVYHSRHRKHGVVTSSPISQQYVEELPSRDRMTCKDTEERGSTQSLKSQSSKHRKSMPAISTYSNANETVLSRKQDANASKGDSFKNRSSFPSSLQQTCAYTPSGDSSIHFQSVYEPYTLNRCWTISDFKQTVRVPNMLKSFSLNFPDASPQLVFRVKVNKDDILVLKPCTATSLEEIKYFGEKYVKVGVSVGPHKNLDADFTVESPVVLLKKLPKLRLEILEIEKLLESYLVDGCLNLIVRYTTLNPVTSPVKNTSVSRFVSSKDVINCCSEFALHSPSLHSKTVQHNTQVDYSHHASDSDSCSSTEECPSQMDHDSDSDDSFTSSSSFLPRRQSYPLDKSKRSSSIISKSGLASKAKAETSSISKDFSHLDISLGKCWDRDHPRSGTNEFETTRYDKTRSSVPRALSTSKVQVGSQDMMNLNWDVSTIVTNAPTVLSNPPDGS